MRTLVLAVTLSVVLSSCTNLTVEEDRTLSVDLVATPDQAAVGEEIDFRASAVGSSIVRFEFYYGDGAADTVATFGAQEASASESHAYQEPGEFTASAVARETFGDSARAEVRVTVVEN